MQYQSTRGQNKETNGNFVQVISVHGMLKMVVMKSWNCRRVLWIVRAPASAGARGSAIFPSRTNRSAVRERRSRPSSRCAAPGRFRRVNKVETEQQDEARNQQPEVDIVMRREGCLGVRINQRQQISYLKAAQSIAGYDHEVNHCNQWHRGLNSSMIP